MMRAVLHSWWFPWLLVLANVAVIVGASLDIREPAVVLLVWPCGAAVLVLLWSQRFMVAIAYHRVLAWWWCKRRLRELRKVPPAQRAQVLIAVTARQLARLRAQLERDPAMPVALRARMLSDADALERELCRQQSELLARVSCPACRPIVVPAGALDALDVRAAQEPGELVALPPARPCPQCGRTRGDLH